MLQHKRIFAIFATLLMCCSLAYAKEKTSIQFSAHLDQNRYANNSVEIPLESIQQFVQVYDLVKNNYVAEKSDDTLFLQAIQGLVSGLDRYSRYLSSEEYKQLIQYTEGDLASVDFTLNFDTSSYQWKINGLKKDSDSYKIGLRNDLSVQKIDHQELKSLNVDQVQALLYGTIGTTLQIQVDSMQPITLVRNKKIETDIEPLFLHNQVLVLKIRVFQQDTANEIKRLIEEYHPARLRAVLIDLRNNPGGLLSSAVESADLFLNEGLIVSTASRSEGSQQFQALPGNKFQTIKLGVLINQRSASAAEVFTAALKEHQRAWVIGETSYGKGVVQKLFPLPNGAAVQMTVSHYYTPEGHMIEGRGIIPNLYYPLTKDVKDETYLDHVADLLLKHRK